METLPGALVAVMGIFLGSAGLGYYFGHLAHYNKTYGSLGAVIILMVWFYLVALLFVVGAEWNAELLKLKAVHAEPATMAMPSFNFIDGAMGIGRCVRHLNEMRSATAHARKPPNSTTLASMPVAMRCATAQSMMPISIGCLRAPLRRPGRYAAKSNVNTGSMRMAVM